MVPFLPPPYIFDEGAQSNFSLLLLLLWRKVLLRFSILQSSSLTSFMCSMVTGRFNFIQDYPSFLPLPKKLLTSIFWYNWLTKWWPSSNFSSTCFLGGFDEFLFKLFTLVLPKFCFVNFWLFSEVIFSFLVFPKKPDEEVNFSSKLCFRVKFNWLP